MNLCCQIHPRWRCTSCNEQWCTLHYGDTFSGQGHSYSNISGRKCPITSRKIQARLPRTTEDFHPITFVEI